MTKEESAQKALIEATDLKFTSAYSKGWDDAVEKACVAFCANCECGQATCKALNINCPQYKKFRKVLEA